MFNGGVTLKSFILTFLKSRQLSLLTIVFLLFDIVDKMVQFKLD